MVAHRRQQRTLAYGLNMAASKGVDLRILVVGISGGYSKTRFVDGSVRSDGGMIKT